MGKYFTLQELCHSQTAIQQGIDNTPPPAIKVNLLSLITNCLDPIRGIWGRPVTVTSGFRTPLLNKVVCGVPTSQHMKGEAADITVGSPDNNRMLFAMIQAADIPFDQLIDENNYAWIHVSWKSSGNRHQVLHL